MLIYFSTTVLLLYLLRSALPDLKQVNEIEGIIMHLNETKIALVYTVLFVSEGCFASCSYVSVLGRWSHNQTSRNEGRISEVGTFGLIFLTSMF